jgi:6-phosphogluconolactonase
MTEPEIETFPSPEALAAAVAGRLVVRLAAIQATGRTPSVVLTGGTVAVKVHEAVVTATEGHEDVDWGDVDFWWGDERYVSRDDPERNAKQAWDAMLSRLDVSPGRVHEMPASDGTHESLQDAADAYADTLRSRGGGRFDVVMLGVGPDGHVASLFPGSAGLDVDDAVVVAVTDSPKPPPERISLTFGALNRAREVWFVVTGESKAGAVAQALASGGDAADVHRVPAAGVHGQDATVWFLDEEAASKLVD